MTARRIWLTWMTDDDGEGAAAAVAALGRAGLEVAGAPWSDDLEKMAWSGVAEHLGDADAEPAWVIAGSAADFASPSKRYGLSMALCAVARTRDPFPLLLLVGTDGPVEPASLPTVLRARARTLDGSASGWAERVLAATIRKPTPWGEPFRLHVIADPYAGQWIEVGPVSGEWQGAMLGVDGGGKIDVHAVGPAGRLPERTVLEYAMEGIVADIGGHEFTAFAVQNRIGGDQSYFVKVTGHPERIVIGEHPDGDAEVSVVTLK